MTNVEMNPSAKSIGVLGGSSPPTASPATENTLIPVGTAIRKVEIIIGIRSQSAIPATNMWCAQTENASTRIPISDMAISR